MPAFTFPGRSAETKPMDRAELMEELKKQLHEEMKAYRASVEGKLPPEALTRAKEWHHSVQELIEKNPWAAVGIASAASFLLARWLYRREDE